MATTAKNTRSSALIVLACLAVVAVVVIAAMHGHSAGASLAIHGNASQLRQLAIPPMHPLPGATPAEWASYLQAKASYCALMPHAPMCS